MQINCGTVSTGACWPVPEVGEKRPRSGTQDVGRESNLMHNGLVSLPGTLNQVILE
jgi:hypothetical protein